MVNFNLYELERADLAKLFFDTTSESGGAIAMLSMIEHDLHVIACILEDIRKG